MERHPLTKSARQFLIEASGLIAFMLIILAIVDKNRPRDQCHG